MKKWLLLLGVFFFFCSGTVTAQKPKGTYSDHKKHIRQDYKKQMMTIAKRKDLSATEKRRRRDAAIDRYLSEKKANRVVYRRKVSSAENPLTKRNRPK